MTPVLPVPKTHMKRFSGYTDGKAAVDARFHMLHFLQKLQEA